MFACAALGAETIAMSKPVATSAGVEINFCSRIIVLLLFGLD